jgi:nitroreductase
MGSGIFLKKLIKTILPKKLFVHLKRVLEMIDLVFISLFSKSGLSSMLYYTFFSRQFRRECQSVLKGRLKYHQGVLEQHEVSALLRRNTHRLEKGLSMKPRREIFAEDYILETVETLRPYKDSSKVSDETKWIFDVLDNYFESVSSSPSIDKASKIYDELKDGLLYRSIQKIGPKKFIPYQRKNSEQSDIKFDSFIKLCKQRRSVRWYEDKVVSDELIKNAISAATFAPSACNRQPFYYLLFKGPEAQKISSVAMGTAGYSHNINHVMIVIGRLDLYPSERDRHVIYIDAALSAMSFMFALETLELASCPINWPDIEFKEKQLSNLLQLKNEERPIMMISFGYPDPNGSIPYSQKKSVEQILRTAKQT